MINERQDSPLSLMIAGSNEFVRRLSAALQSAGRYQEFVRVCPTHLPELRSAITSERPDILLIDIGLSTTPSDVDWLREVLSYARDRIGQGLHILIAATAPERFYYVGDLLFQKDGPAVPSHLIDSLIISPPPGALGSPSLEEQLFDLLDHLLELRSRNDPQLPQLPTLSSDSWAPALCDPSSRAIWMRWLPRFARYTSESPLIVGPSGSGKTKLAAALHYLSGRKGPFVSMTPRDFSSNELVQAELFGAVPGAYTGAVEKWGLVHKAEKGTLFIDELQSIDRDLQGKLITFVESKAYRRVGEAESHQADVRFVFATNRPLPELVASGALRDDFAYRLERLQIELKPLHERRLDIAAGLCFALAKVARERQTSPATATRQEVVEGLSQGAYRRLYAAAWPGNLRQLENAVAKLIENTQVERLRCIQEHQVDETLQGMLGYRPPSASDLFSRAAAIVAVEAERDGISRIGELSERLVASARRLSLEAVSGDVEKAAALIGDSAEELSVFAVAGEKGR